MKVKVLTDIAHLKGDTKFENAARALLGATPDEASFEYTNLNARDIAPDSFDYLLVTVTEWDSDADDAFYRAITHARVWGHRTVWEDEALRVVCVVHDEYEVAPGWIAELSGQTPLCPEGMIEAFLSVLPTEGFTRHFTAALVAAFLRGGLPPDVDWGLVESANFAIKTRVEATLREIRIAATNVTRRPLFAELVGISRKEDDGKRVYEISASIAEPDALGFDGEANAKLWYAVQLNLTGGWFVRFQNGGHATYKLGVGVAICTE